MTRITRPQDRTTGPRMRVARCLLFAIALVVVGIAGASPWQAAGGDQSIISNTAALADPFGMWTKYARNPILDDTSVNGTLVKSILSDLEDPLRQPLLYPHPTMGNRYWMAYANLGWGGSIRLAYSSDLLTWTRYGGNPVLLLGAEEYYMSSPVLFRDRGVYYLVYDVAMASAHGEAQRLAYATAASPLGPWQRGGVILDLGAAGAWDEGRVTEPFMWKDGDTYYLYYMGDLKPPYARGEQVGVATTPASSFPRGPWVKRGLALPIHQSTTAWDRGLTADPSVMKVDGTYYMLYTGSTGGGDWKLGIAWASNPLGPWQRPEQPTLMPGPAAWDNYALVRGTLTYHEGRYYLFYSGSGQGASDRRFRGGVAVAEPGVAPLALRVNCGGETYTDSAGVIWERDRAYSAGGWGYVSGEAGTSALDIVNTVEDQLYQDERTWRSSSTPGYTFNVPAGRYEVTFRFAETQYTAIGQRKFDVRIRGVNVLIGLDIVAAAGGARRAVDRVVTVDVPDGVLNIGFVHLGAGSPKVNAIQVRQIAGSLALPATATATPSRTATRTPTSPPAITPSASSTPTRTATAVASPTPTPTHANTTTVRLVNVGGGRFSDGSGALWLADQPFALGGWGYVGGSAYSVTAAIAGTDDDLLYQSERYNLTAYRFTVPNGTYEVTLKFAELYCTSVSCRVFDVFVQGAKVLSGFNLYVAAGGRFAAVDRVFSATVNNGLLEIGFAGNAPKLNAVAVRSLN